MCDVLKISVFKVKNTLIHKHYHMVIAVKATVCAADVFIVCYAVIFTSIAKYYCINPQ